MYNRTPEGELQKGNRKIKAIKGWAEYLLHCEEIGRDYSEVDWPLTPHSLGDILYYIDDNLSDKRDKAKKAGLAIPNQI